MLTPQMEDRSFIALLVIVSLAFAWLLLPFYGAVFWGAVLAIIFSPLQRRLSQRLGGRHNLAALLTLGLCLLIAILPMLLVAAAMVDQGAQLYLRLKDGQLNFGNAFEQVMTALPAWVQDFLARLGLSDMSGLQEKLSSGAMRASQFVATQAFSIGQNTFQFVAGFGVMLYLLFFLLRDGQALGRRIFQAAPLRGQYKDLLFEKFAAVVRATVKGNIVIALVQGVLGGFIFWALGVEGALLWGALMAFLSLLPAVGAGLVWGPVAIWFLATGSIWQGVVLILFGVLVIGLVDNLLRPVLVGKDTRMPDYVVLISTLGGMTLFGLNGFVIGPLIAALFIACWDIFTGQELEAPAS